jgi:glycosyltransferase involved in cell wall biosynthesis
LAEHIPLCTRVGVNGTFERLFKGRTGNRLLFIGRLEEVKNVHLLLECFAQMRKHLPHLNLTVAGEYTGEPEQMKAYRATLADLVQRERLEDAVTFAGPVDGETKAELFRSADLLINLSTDPGETFGFNLIEAKAWGLPVVCTRWDGFQELVSDGEDGFLIPCDWTYGTPVIDKVQTIERCLQVLRHINLRRSLAERSFQSAASFDYRLHFPKMMKAVAAHSKHTISPMPEAVDLATSELAELRDIYELDRLRGLPFYRDSLLSIVARAGGNPTKPSLWMPFAKPVIHHFAGGSAYAKL